MSSHTPTRDHQLITCDACAFRAVETTRGVWITEVGDTRVDHLATVHARQAALRAEVEQSIRNLMGRYRADPRYSMALMKRLFDHIRAEHGL